MSDNLNHVNSLRMGIVKKVISGDTIIIRNEPKDNRVLEKTIVLSGITVARFGRKIRKGDQLEEIPEESFAWEAREYLRKLLIGKEVFFSSRPFDKSDGFSNDRSSSDREIGKVFYPTENDDVTKGLISNGFAKLKEARSGNSENPSAKKMMQLQRKANLNNLGLWGAQPLNRSGATKKPEYSEKFVEFFEKKPVDAIVESVRFGKFQLMLDLTLMPSFIPVPLAVAGIKTEDNSPFAEEAKFFVEKRLLQQDVKVTIERHGNNLFVGSVFHPNGNIAERLLEEGFVMCDKRYMPESPDTAAAYMAAEQRAKDKHLRKWEEFVAPEEEPEVEKEQFKGVVTEVFGDGLFVKTTNGDEEEPVKVFFSCIRLAKGKEGAKSVFESAISLEIREVLRKKLLNKKVTVTIDFEQSSERDDYLPSKKFCTVMVGKLNIATTLVANGLATIVNSKENRKRPGFEELVAAEQKAKDSKKGMHGDDPDGGVLVVDLTSPNQSDRAQSFLSDLKKQEKIKAVVEYVFSGSRVKLYLPDQSLLVIFLMSGVVCSRPNGPRTYNGDEFGDKAMNLVKDKVMQRDVEVVVEGIDKRGCFVGTLMFNKVNLALELVKKGLARVMERRSTPSELVEALKKAQENKIGIWEFEEPPPPPVTEEQTSEEKVEESFVNGDRSDEGPNKRVNGGDAYGKGDGKSRPPNRRRRREEFDKVYITEVNSELQFYAQYERDKEALDKLSVQLQEELANSPDTFTKDNPPERRAWVAAKYSSDNCWYRAQVEKNIPSDGKSVVRFIDYGNEECIPNDNIAVLPEYLSEAKPYATKFIFAYLDMPPEQYIEEVAQELTSLLADRTFKLRIEFEDDLPCVRLKDTETDDDVNKMLIEKGLFYSQRRGGRVRDLIDGYRKAETSAKNARNFIWEHGDARPDYAREFGA